MTEPLTGFHEMRSNPQIMIKGKAAPFFLPRQENMSGLTDADASAPTSSSRELSEEQRRMLQELRLRDATVRKEEEAHARLLGRHAGAIRYEYQIGPDGRPYVINGSVEVNPKFNSTKPEDIRKVLQTIQRAAVSVSNPSQADLNVAASAASRVSILSQRTAMETYRNGIEAQSSASIPTDRFSSNQLEVQA